MASTKIFITASLFLFSILACDSSESRKEVTTSKPAEPAEPAKTKIEDLNTLTMDEKSDGWVLLFDGVSTQGWHSYLGDENTGWKVEDGLLYTEGGIGDIVTDAEFVDFELKVDWKIEDQGNSGVFYYVIESPEYPRIHHTGPEFQIIDDNNYPQQLNDNQKTGSNSDVLAPVAFNANQPGNWNSTRILAREGEIEHWLNGEKILEFDVKSPEWRTAVANSKFSEFDYAEQLEGKIGLQDHGGPVAFKNIKIRKF